MNWWKQVAVGNKIVRLEIKKETLEFDVHLYFLQEFRLNRRDYFLCVSRLRERQLYSPCRGCSHLLPRILCAHRSVRSATCTLARCDNVALLSVTARLSRSMGGWRAAKTEVSQVLGSFSHKVSREPPSSPSLCSSGHHIQERVAASGPRTCASVSLQLGAPLHTQEAFGEVCKDFKMKTFHSAVSHIVFIGMVVPQLQNS